MSKWLSKLPKVYPSTRLAAAFAAGSLWFFAIPWGHGLFLWLGVAYNALLLALAIFDYRRLADSHNCSVTRERLTTLSIAEQNPVWVGVDHRGNLPIRVQVKDEPPDEFQATGRMLTFDLEPGESERKNYRVRPEERGDYQFGDVNARFTTPLGLMMRQVRIPSQTMVKVYPDVLQAEKHRLLARENRIIQMGFRRSRIHGQGTEFDRLRDYMADDPMRHIDWKATARRNTLITREYDVERSQNIMLLLDIGRNMASRTVEEDGKLGITKADSAINASILLAHVAAQSDDRIGLYCFAEGPIAYVPPGKGAPQAARLLEALYPLQPRIEETDYYRNFMLAVQKQRKRSLVFLFTDLIDAEASKRLISSIGILARKHLVVCIALADYELPSIVESKPAKPQDLYTKTVAIELVRNRRKALAQLAGQGAIAMDATPSDLSVVTVNKYLQLKREGRL